MSIKAPFAVDEFDSDPLGPGGYASKLDDWGNTTLGRTEDKETLNGNGDGSGQRDEHELGQR